MPKQNIVFVTGNKNKLKEVVEILGDDFAVINIAVDLQEIQSTSVKEVIQEKIKEADKIFQQKDILNDIKEEFKKLNVSVNDYKDFTIICEDTGFHIDSMNIGEKAEKEPTMMFPGALIKFYLQALGAKGIIEMNKDSKARLSCYIGVIRNGEIKEPVEAVVEGTVANSYSEGGFGFDPCFVPDLEDKQYEGLSYGQLPSEIKNQISHRAVAFNKLKNMLSMTNRRATRRAKSKRAKSKQRGGLVDFEAKYLKYMNKLNN